MTATIAGPPVAVASPRARSQGIALRRGIVLVLFSLLVPGSAQLAAGSRRVGLWAVRVWATILGVAMVLGLLALPFRAFVIGLVGNQIVMFILQWGVLAYGIAWSLLILDAWRLADPRAMSRAGAIVSGVLALALAVTGTGVAWGTSSIIGEQRSLIGDIFGGGGNTQVQNGRYNVLLLGGDAGADRTGLRPDSMTVASIDAETGRTVLFSLPRNMQKVPFPVDSPLHKLYPNGYYCQSKSLSNVCLLNGVYTLAMQHKNLFPGVKNPGVEATRSVIEEILGLKINYWAMIDMKGFEKLIDAVGGIRLDVGTKVGIGSEHGKHGVFAWIPAGKNQLLTGFQALWFARSRVASDDYVRMLRQKCVMSAMLKQLDPMTVLTKFQALAAAGKQVVATNVPSDQLGVLVDLATKGKALPLASISFTPPLITPKSPDFAKVRTLVSEAIATSEAKDKTAANPQQSQAQQPASQAPASQSPSSTKPSGGGATTKTRTDNIDAICKVS
jgi:polyisoprenyl-teichoic acid--peptidoglycan teichoic acid transferase